MINRTQHVMFTILFVSLTIFSCQEKNTQTQEVKEKKEAKMEESAKKEKVLRHVVIFKFKDESSEEDVNILNEAFNALPKSIPVIKDFEWGLNDSPENFHQDFSTHVKVVTLVHTKYYSYEHTSYH